MHLEVIFWFKKGTFMYHYNFKLQCICKGKNVTVESDIMINIK